MSQEQGLCGAWQQAKQNCRPQWQVGSRCGSLSTCTARPQCGTLGHLHVQHRRNQTLTALLHQTYRIRADVHAQERTLKQMHLKPPADRHARCNMLGSCSQNKAHHLTRLLSST